MTPDRLNFSTNWNKKLDCDFFSTIRLWNEAVHYEGKEVEIYDNSTKQSRYKGRGKYVIVSRFKLCQLKPANAMLDTGYSLEETRNIIRTMYHKKINNVEQADFAYIIVQKIKEEHKQNTLEL